MKREIYERQVQRALDMYEKANIILTEQEKKNIEVVDFEIGIVDEVGLQMITYVNTQRV